MILIKKNSGHTDSYRGHVPYQGSLKQKCTWYEMIRLYIYLYDYLLFSYFQNNITMSWYRRYGQETSNPSKVHFETALFIISYQTSCSISTYCASVVCRYWGIHEKGSGDVVSAVCYDFFEKRFFPGFWSPEALF